MTDSKVHHNDLTLPLWREMIKYQDKIRSFSKSQGSIVLRRGLPDLNNLVVSVLTQAVNVQKIDKV